MKEEKEDEIYLNVFGRHIYLTVKSLEELPNNDMAILHLNHVGADKKLVCALSGDVYPMISYNNPQPIDIAISKEEIKKIKKGHKYGSWK